MPARRICAGAVGRKLERMETEIVSLPSFSADVERRNCDVPLCAENEKEKVENRKRRYFFNVSLCYLYMALSFFPLSADV